MVKTIFKQITANEVKLTLKGDNYLLVEQDRGVYGAGRAIQLYKLNGVEKVHLVELGWVQKDNYGGENKKDKVIQGITTWDACKKAAVEYLNNIL